MAVRLRLLSTSVSSAPSVMGAALTCHKSHVSASSAEVAAARLETMVFAGNARSAMDQASRLRPPVHHAMA